MQTNTINTKTPAFGAKIGSKLKLYAQKDARFENFMKEFSKWGDSNSVVDIYNSKINGKTKYMLRLENQVLDRTNVRITNDESVYMPEKLINTFFNLTEKSILWAEDRLFIEVKKFLKTAPVRYREWSANIIKQQEHSGKVFDHDTAQRFQRL